MPQELSATGSQELTTGGSGGFNTTTGFATGATCTSSGTYRSSSKYIDAVIALAAGELFPPDINGKKTTWYALSPSLSSNKDGSFTSVKVEAGAI
jgi:hypothetical protein